MPLPDVVENLVEEKDIKNMLVEGVTKLEDAGVDFIAIPCNTVNLYFQDMQNAVSIPIINLLQETVYQVNYLGLKKVGLLATESTIKGEIYGSLLKNVELLTLNKFEQKETTKIILRILAGKNNLNDAKRLKGYIKKLINLGAEKVILGCTELPLIINFDKNVLDTIEILKNSIIDRLMIKNYLSLESGRND